MTKTGVGFLDIFLVFWCRIGLLQTCRLMPRQADH